MEKGGLPHIYVGLLTKQTYSSPFLLVTRRSSATRTDETMSSPNHNVAIRDDRILTMIAKANVTLARHCHHGLGPLLKPEYTEGKTFSKKRTKQTTATRNVTPAMRLR